MGAANKLLCDLDGRPLVAHAAAAAAASRATPVLVVTGHEADAVRAALADHDVKFVHNPDYADGLSTSLAAGLSALRSNIDGAVVCLGDMPRVRAATIDALIAAFEPGAGRAICMPMYDGRRGNPVLWASRYFPEIAALKGDRGARGLMADHADALHEIETDDPGIHADVDTPEALKEA